MHIIAAGLNLLAALLVLRSVSNPARYSGMTHRQCIRELAHHPVFLSFVAADISFFW